MPQVNELPWLASFFLIYFFLFLCSLSIFYLSNNSILCSKSISLFPSRFNLLV